MTDWRHPCQNQYLQREETSFYPLEGQEANMNAEEKQGTAWTRAEGIMVNSVFTVFEIK